VGITSTELASIALTGKEKERKAIQDLIDEGKGTIYTQDETVTSLLSSILADLGILHSVDTQGSAEIKIY
jgi:hypothetical protein